MSGLDARLRPIAARRRNLITRADVFACGGTDAQIRARLATGRWQALHAGVYLVGAAPPDWLGRLHAAVLAAGEGAVASHRSAVVLWGLDGIAGTPVEVTVGMDAKPECTDATVRRTRRPPPAVVRRGVPVTDIDRALLDAASCLPRIVVAKAFESAYRRGHTTPARLLAYVSEHGGRGVDGTRMLRDYLLSRGNGRAAGSGAEVEMLELLFSWGIEQPERQFRIPLGRSQVATVDLAWPARRKAVEIDGFDAHSSPTDLATSNDRQNRILEAGWDLRRYPGTQIRRHPDNVARSVRRFLDAPANPFRGDLRGS